MFSEQSTNPSRSELLVDDLNERPVWQEQAAKAATDREEPKRAFAKIRDHDWIAALCYVICDIACWVCVYGFVSFVRRDAFFVSPFEFVLVDGVVLAVILQALYIIGGYNRNTEMRGLSYMTEHILAVAAAAAISSLLIYSAATFDAE